jgi:hypothetical protein
MCLINGCICWWKEFWWYRLIFFHYKKVQALLPSSSSDYPSPTRTHPKWHISLHLHLHPALVSHPRNTPDPNFRPQLYVLSTEIHLQDLQAKWLNQLLRMKQTENKKLHTVHCTHLHAESNILCHSSTQQQRACSHFQSFSAKTSDLLPKAAEVLKLKSPSQDSLKMLVRIYFHRGNPRTACPAINYNRLSELNDSS